MSSVFYEFDEVDEFSSGAVGEPGSPIAVAEKLSTSSNSKNTLTRSATP